MEYGYIRVSCKDQNVERQLIEIHKLINNDKNIYIDKESGKDFDRKKYKQLLRRLKPNDLVYIKSIDRLGRDYRTIIEQWRIITKEKGADIVVIDMPLLDTRTGKDLIGTFLSDVVLEILSFVSENERANIRQRQAEGIAAARKRGVKFGRPTKPLPPNFNNVYQDYIEGKLSVKQCSKLLGMPETTYRYWLKKLENKKIQ